MAAYKPGTVTIAGAGLAGLAAGCALAQAGWRVRVLERRPYVGGRASSYEHPGTGEVLDNCQHILLGCCTNLRRLLEQVGAAQEVTWFDRFTYIEPGGRRSILAPGSLPAPFHTSSAFWRMKAFGLRDKLAIARGMLQFLRGAPRDTGETFASWCRRTGQTSTAVARFWRPVLVSALNEELENVSLHYAGMVIHDCLLASPEAARMGVPKIPLSELYARAADFILERGGHVELRAAVEGMEPCESGWRVRAGGESLLSDAVVLALPFEQTAKLLPAVPAAAGVSALSDSLYGLAHSPITSVHLWFDREVTELPHAVLLDAPVDWMYNVSQLQPWRAPAGHGSYLDLVVSASHAMVGMSREQVLELTLGSLGKYLPRVREARLLKAAVTKEVRATFSVPPGVDRLRPAQDASPWPGVYLAGDWTRTGWPATMEGAVRSGFLAAEGVVRGAGGSEHFLVPDLPASGWMRWLGRSEGEA
jgi:squalene-associated FAD-dependent desaturase